MTRTVTATAKSLNRRARRRFGADLPPLMLMTDERRLPNPLAAARALPAGSLVVLRHYGWARAERLALALRLSRLCRERRLRLLVAVDVALAAAIRADGLHLPEGLARAGATPALAWVRDRNGLLSVAAHGPQGLALAARLGADAATLSPVFATASHPGAAVIGDRRFRILSGTAPLPVYALGGVNQRTVRRLATSGAIGIAAIAGLTIAQPER